MFVDTLLKCCRTKNGEILGHFLSVCAFGGSWGKILHLCEVARSEKAISGMCTINMKIEPAWLELFLKFVLLFGAHYCTCEATRSEKAISGIYAPSDAV